MRHHIVSIFLLASASLSWPSVAFAVDQRNGPDLARAMRQLADGHESEYRKQISALCEAGDTDAQVAYGHFLIAKREYGEAERWLTKAAATGSADGQYSLGVLYFQVTPQRLPEAKLWMEKASRQGHARAFAVVQMFNKKARVGPGNQLSVVDILEGTALLGQLKTETLSVREIKCTGRTPESFQAAFKASSSTCETEVHSIFGDWVVPERSKEVGVLWGQCVNREILKPSGISYAEFMRCRSSPPTSP